jgi:hypothetical protein
MDIPTTEVACPVCAATVIVTVEQWAQDATAVCPNGHSVILEGVGAKDVDGLAAEVGEVPISLEGAPDL